MVGARLKFRDLVAYIPKLTCVDECIDVTDARGRGMRARLKLNVYGGSVVVRLIPWPNGRPADLVTPPAPRGRSHHSDMRAAQLIPTLPKPIHGTDPG
jgi:hypothetical protein